MLQLPGKGLARSLNHCSSRFQPLPLGTAREVFPQAARPMRFVERVMRPVAKGRLLRRLERQGGVGQSSPSTNQGRHRGIRYSIAAIRY